MEDLGTKLTIGGLLIRAIGYTIRRKNPVVLQIERSDGPKTKKIKIQANSGTEAQDLFECVEKHQKAPLN